MKSPGSRLSHVLLALVLCASVNRIKAQGTAFTYQGRLQNNGGPVSGSYDLTFTLFSSNTGGAALAGPITNSAVGVSNGLFTVTIDFGSSVWNGATNWLEIGVETNGGSAFATLTPRQQFTAAPYAVTAEGVISGGITSGMLASGAVTGDKIAAGAVNGASIDDGGSGAYQAFQQAELGAGGDSTLAFANLAQTSSANGVSPGFSFTINGSAFGRVVGFSGYEGISQPYYYVVEVSSPGAVVNPDSELGQAGQLTYSRSGHITSFGGLVTACTSAGLDGTNFLHTVRLESPLAYMALKTDYGIYQNLSFPTVVSSVYRAVTTYVPTLNLSGTYSPHTFCVQYRETSFNFVSRLMEEEGIFYFFNQGSAVPGLVMGDNTSAYLASPNSPFVYYGNTTTNIPVGEYVRSFQRASHQSTLTSTINSYDFTAPGASLLASISGQEGVQEQYEFGNDVQTLGYDQQLAQDRQDHQTVERMTIAGAGTAPDLRAGYTFSLSDQSGAGLSGSYLVTSIHHAGFVRMTNGVSTVFYGNEFQAIPASLIYRPALVTPKPQGQPETAIVTAPAGQEIYTDKYGRVKVQFFWDRQGKKDQNSSCWIRVANPMAGSNGRGMIFLPRVGDEVVVSFLEGDPDRPIIIGSLYNGTEMPPYALPVNQAISTIRTTGTPGQPAQVNEISFNDTASAQVLTLQAAKDLTVKAANNIGISGVNNFNTTVGGTMALKSTGNLSLQTSGNVTIQGTALSLQGPGGLSLQGPTTATGPLSVSGGMNIDQADANNGSDTANALTFGASSGEGIASQRTASGTGNQYDLALFTGFNPRLTILNGGNIGIGTSTPTAPFHVQGGQSGTFANPVALIVNTNTTTPSPALRIINAGGAPADGALSVSVNSVGNGLLAEFGNANSFVTTIANNGTISATAFNTTSDRNAKEDFESISPVAILEKVASLPISSWDFKTVAGVKHLGPVAQDFHAAFGLNGTDDKHISLVDEGGVALAAIQGLNQKLREKEATIQEQASSLKEQAAEIADLKARLDQVEKVVLERTVSHR